MNLYHYCSNEAFLSILSSNEVWLSELSLSNDHMEGRWIRKVFEDSCKGLKVKDFDRNRLLSHLDETIDLMGGAGFCLSEEGDLLSQWRGYADDGTGMSLGFSRKYFRDLSEGGRLDRFRSASGGNFGFDVSRVNYDILDQEKQLAGPLKDILKYIDMGAFNPRVGGLLSVDIPDKDKEAYDHALSEVLDILFGLSPLFHSMKNPAFKEEKEWRLVSTIIRSDLVEYYDYRNMEFRSTGDRIIPFHKLPLLKIEEPSIKEVILGPRNITPESIVQSVLLKYGYDGVEVKRSNASYR